VYRSHRQQGLRAFHWSTSELADESTGGRRITECPLSWGPDTFAIVDSIRACICPQASFHATFIACSRFPPTPVVNLEVGMGLKKAESDLLRSGQMGMFGSTEPETKLQALVAVSNEAAKKAGPRVPSSRINWVRHPYKNSTNWPFGDLCGDFFVLYHHFARSH
jgi:hypothetical protein